MAKVVGIDLGTSTTCIAVVDNGTPTVIKGARNLNITPSYIYVIDDGRILIGENAKSEVIADPYNTVWATKRLIGRKFDDKSVQESIKRMSYKIVSSKKGDILVHGRDKVFTPINVASLILKLVIRLASKFLDEPVQKAVITVPASFNDLQRKATKQAGVNIGLDVIRLVNEPTAAALAWGYHENIDQTIAVYDLGGGTFDVSIMSIGKNVFEVLATCGDSWLGGEDFDNCLVDDIVKKFKADNKINIMNDKMAHQRLKTAAEIAKIELSTKDSTRIHLPSICPDVSRYADVDYTYTREEFESLVEGLVDKTIETFKAALEDAEIELSELDNVIIVGGMTRLPLVRRKIKDFLGKDADCSINPDEAVAMGAAIHAAALSGEAISVKGPKVTKRAEVPAGPDDEGPVVNISPNTGSEFEPDDVHALGGEDETEKGKPGQWVGEAQNENVPAPAIPESSSPQVLESDAPTSSADAPLLIDVLSQSVGIADMAALFVPLIKNNTKLPAKVSQVVTTCMDHQDAIRISVYQGEERHVANQVRLGEFVLDGIEKAARGVAQIKVTFVIDQSGLFTVRANDLKTNVEKEIRVEGAEI